MNILLLYSELASYTLACIREVVKTHPSDKITVIHFPVNKEAPFELDFSIANFHPLSDFSDYSSLQEFVGGVRPDIILCSGWINNWYVQLSKEYYYRAITIMALDNHWTGSLKQRIMVAMSRMGLGIRFHYAWVPGSPQWDYARKLGFAAQKILTGFYCCDTERFLELGERYRRVKEKQFPRVLLCVARYIPEKGYDQLWRSFLEWNATQQQPWELWCAGTGDGFTNRIQHPSIRHFGFIQPEEWESVIERTGFFVLFSHFEPWGVVVHEFAAAGYPMIVSSKVGAAEKLVTEENGWQIDPKDHDQVASVFSEIGSLSQEEYNTKSIASRKLAASLLPKHWVNSLYSVR